MTNKPQLKVVDNHVTVEQITELKGIDAVVKKQALAPAPKPKAAQPPSTVHIIGGKRRSFTRVLTRSAAKRCVDQAKTLGIHWSTVDGRLDPDHIQGEYDQYMAALGAAAIYADEDDLSQDASQEAANETGNSAFVDSLMDLAGAVDDNAMYAEIEINHDV